jgi:hypothetical protein
LPERASNLQTTSFQMRGLIRQLLGSKARELDSEAERLENLLRDSAVTEQQEAESLRVLESEQERLTTRNYELETELRQNQNLLGQTALELDRAENRIGFNAGNLNNAIRTSVHEDWIVVIDADQTLPTNYLAALGEVVKESVGTSASAPSLQCRRTARGCPSSW